MDLSGWQRQYYLSLVARRLAFYVFDKRKFNTINQYITYKEKADRTLNYEH